VLLLQPALSSADPISLIKHFVARRAASKLLVLLDDTTSGHLAARMIRAGAHGIILESLGSEGVTRAVRQVVEGDLFLSPELERLYAYRHLLGQAGPPEELLSERELQVLLRLAQGQTNREIANDLFISVKTVDTYRASLLRKLDLRNNADITRFALQTGLL
jgi:DNA-binding NarL/FixJ family response regulator